MTPPDLAPEDRRRRRSSDPLVALHYQLSTARRAGSLDAIVVADPSGVVVAGAGSWATCEELAAYAPLMVHPAPMSDETSSRVDTLRREVEVRSLEIGGQEVLLCARGGSTHFGVRDASVARAIDGVSRILSAPVL